jgi:hypothetical protein
MTVTVPAMGGVMHTGMMMPSRVGDIAGDRQRRSDRGTR